MDDPRAFLRHAVATLAYRGAKALRGAPPDFAAFRAADGTRTPGQIVAHLCDLLDWAVSLGRGENRWSQLAPDDWDRDVERFFAGLAALDAFLADNDLRCEAERLFQGPIADALTHVGQVTLLRRLAGAPVRGENYFRADIAAGRVGAEQVAPRREFD